jgi:hypothetical protein
MKYNALADADLRIGTRIQVTHSLSGSAVKVEPAA